MEGLEALAPKTVKEEVAALEPTKIVVVLEVLDRTKMEKTEVKHHERMKTRFPETYPKLPKALTGKTKFKGGKDHLASVIEGFRGRLANWTRDQSLRDVNVVS